MKYKDLLDEIQNKSLMQASILLDKKSALTDEDVRAAEKLVSMAIAIGYLNLQRDNQTRSYGAVFRGQPSLQTSKENSTRSHAG